MSSIAILLTGSCKDAGGLRNVYVLSVSTHGRDTARQANTTISEVRIGYFGICAYQSDRDGWTCNAKQSSFFENAGSSDTDTLGVLAIAERFRADVIFPGLM